MEHLQPEVHFLFPGNIYTSKKPAIVNTILGSCVSVCLWDPFLKVGGINHFMLPLWNGDGLASPKYGNIAIEKLVKKMLQMGSVQANIQAKLFGGAEVIETGMASRFKVGDRNVLLAEEMLQQLRIPVISKSTGGLTGRKIRFFTDSGQVLHKYIEKSQ